jgi:hypothetical protein
MIDSSLVLQLVVNGVILGAFYGATKVELRFINKILDAHGKKIDKILGGAEK